MRTRSDMKRRSMTQKCSPGPGKSRSRSAGIPSQTTNKWSTRAWRAKGTCSTIRKAKAPRRSNIARPPEMNTSTERILTTHVGSLPRPQEVADLLFAQDRGEAYDRTHFDAVMRRGVSEVIRLQREAGIDIVSDGETSKISYATYIRHRLTGFEGDSPRPTPQDIDELPDYRDKLVAQGASAKYLRPVCKGPIEVKDR